MLHFVCVSDITKSTEKFGLSYSISYSRVSSTWPAFLLFVITWLIVTACRGVLRQGAIGYLLDM